MASIPLDFIAPDEDGFTKLLIFESEFSTGPFVLIETVTTIGSFPTYITHYTTDQATSLTYWFAIQWEDAKGGRTEISSPVQGGTNLLVGEIADRVVLRDPSILEQIAVQEAEAVVEYYFNTTDALSILASQATARQISGLTLLTLVSAKLSTISQGTSTGYTAGLVSQTGTVKPSLPDLKALISEANILLGTGYSVIFQMKDNEIAGGTVVMGIPDQSRLLVDLL